ncbi:hypothetical protein SAMN05216327_102140 [Dyadobacter sp. SG02]|uniref:CIS tube protein n=1 Tax=Dyadobacter sp. SG02 TaxID=1855291 RepID=UPI0008C1EE12|nr:hypothetical protein [Dyadobacter sp. SG02]SEI51340.1 hypothetical protein SAMN05216327_102140 [Dyadobacter sp. SG02]
MGYVNKLRIMSVHLDSGSPLAIASSVLQTLAGGVFELQMNPETYSRNFEIEYATPIDIGAPLVHSQFKGVKPEALEIKFTIDGTGIVPVQQPAIDLVTQAFAAAGSDAQVAFVTAKLQQLQIVTYGIQSETHRPPFMVVNWGKLVFMGVLQSMSHTFTLFHESGLPLRVDVTLKINEFKMPSVATAALSLLSPDLTRKHIVKSSDTLINLCLDTYQKPDYYLEIARVNELTNFRRLKQGSELIFPPIANS